MQKGKNFFLLLILALCWSPSYFCIKVGVGSIPPFTLIFMRVFLAALVLVGYCILSGKKFWEWRHYWPHFFVMGLSLNALPFVLIAYGEEAISSSLAAILNGTTPLFALLFGRAFLNDKITIRKILGLTIGFLGIFILYLPDLAAGVTGNELGILLLILSSVSYGFGAVYAKMKMTTLPPMIAPVWQLIMAALTLLPFSLFFDFPLATTPTAYSMFAMCFMSLVGTALAFILYYKLIRQSGPTFVSLTALLVPAGAILLGFLILQEEQGWHSLLGSALILGSVALINPALRKPEVSLQKEEVLKE